MWDAKNSRDSGQTAIISRLSDPRLENWSHKTVPNMMGLSSSWFPYWIVSDVFPRRCSRMLDGERRALEAKRESVLVPCPPGTSAQGGPSILCTLRIRCAKRTTFVRWSASTIVAVPWQRCGVLRWGAYLEPIYFWSVTSCHRPLVKNIEIHWASLAKIYLYLYYLILNEMNAEAIAARICWCSSLRSSHLQSVHFFPILSSDVCSFRSTVPLLPSSLQVSLLVPAGQSELSTAMWSRRCLALCGTVGFVISDCCLWCEQTCASPMICLFSNTLMIIQIITTRCSKCSGATMLYCRFLNATNKMKSWCMWWWKFSNVSIPADE